MATLRHHSPREIAEVAVLTAAARWRVLLDADYDLRIAAERALREAVDALTRAVDAELAQAGGLER